MEEDRYIMSLYHVLQCKNFARPSISLLQSTYMNCRYSEYLLNVFFLPEGRTLPVPLVMNSN
jgi:hypothetical protein